ncbi:MAG TPA: ABC transporter permease [Candidatus Dormibacteraeota bacterium]|nr:ABC transporter permease [Candidatus Dormibacteraeota bacterium]
MAGYVVRRLLTAVPVLFGVTLITFLLMHFTAGNYVPGLQLDPNLKPSDIARIRANLGLDRPLIVQYLDWIGIGALFKAVGLAGVLGGSHNIDPGILEGNFGRSLIDGSPVLASVLGRLPNTLELTATAIVVGLALAVPVGVVSALRRGSRLDQFLTAASVAGFAVPQFWLGLLLILLFSVEFHAWGLPWLPSSGAVSPLGGGGVVDRLQHLALPATVLAFFYLSSWSRFVRSSMIETLSQDYVRTARAKGMSERRTVYVHALRNAVAPLVTLIGLELPGLVSGALVVEVVFGWPGIGLLAFQRALQYDYTTVMGITTFAAVLVVLGNLLADVLYAVIDPRVRYS